MLLAALLSLALFAPIQDPSEEGDPCELNPSPECTAQRIAHNTAKLSLTDVAADLESGAYIYRATFEDGDYWPAVSFERRPNQSPEVVIYGSENRKIRMPISAELWDEVEYASRYAGRELVSDGVETDCVVQTMTNVQIGRPGDSTFRDFGFEFGKPTVVSASQTTCGGGLTSDYALLLASRACAVVPECMVLGFSDGLQALQNLGASLMLRGDKLAAATLYDERRWEPPYSPNATTVDEWDRWLNVAYDARLDWGGEITTSQRSYGDTSSSSIALALAKKTGVHGYISLAPSQFGASDLNHGWIEGFIAYQTDDNRVPPTRAPYRQEWELSGDWRLTSWTIGPFEPTRPGTSID